VKLIFIQLEQAGLNYSFLKYIGMNE
jgi:hypothetical protein